MNPKFKVMANPISLNNVSFDYLKGSSDFVNHIIHNISSCVLLLDKDMMLQAFNYPLKTIFSNKPDEDLLYQRCGEALGCAYSVEEQLDCGSTSKCNSCELRETALLSYLEKKNIYKKQISREFYRTDTMKELKHLQFSTRFFTFNRESYIILIIDDITAFKTQQDVIANQMEIIENLTEIG